MKLFDASKFTYAMINIGGTFSTYNQFILGTTLSAAIREVLEIESEINISEGLKDVSNITLYLKNINS